MSPVREAFGLDGVEENDFEQDNNEIKDRFIRKYFLTSMYYNYVILA